MMKARSGRTFALMAFATAIGMVDARADGLAEFAVCERAGREERFEVAIPACEASLKAGLSIEQQIVAQRWLAVARAQRDHYELAQRKIDPEMVVPPPPGHGMDKVDRLLVIEPKPAPPRLDDEI
jgi:DNA-binding transcriptional regulator YdaS (Cro superfamily)